jgi:hypothetical protein
MKKTWLLFALVVPLLAHAAPEKKDKPSREPVKGCKWEKLSDSKLGLDAWVQRCDFGSRKIDLFAEKNALMIRYSDGGKPDPLIETFDLKSGEAIEAGVKRIFAEHTADKDLVARCVLKPYKGYKEVVPPGVKRYTFVPNAALQKEIDKKNAGSTDVPDPPCGDWGDAPDGIQYFETQPANTAHRVMFVRVGQDEPLFDDQTLRLQPTPAEQMENQSNY